METTKVRELARDLGLDDETAEVAGRIESTAGRLAALEFLDKEATRTLTEERAT